jgi:predicted HTH transcriptional regulator
MHQRSLVESASAFGITQAEIATQLKISEPTLRKHIREELDGGAFKANMRVGGNMYRLTQSADEHSGFALASGGPLAAWAGKRPASTSRLERTAARSKLRT